ncbi:uncharacterized protein LOC111384987 [Olea europaea var. sylvestris]|uniref:uncharacterized protein LOC111384987 n=1 Tax=Olea europaea var. sylvestris TaxID=158386 RepID=UPI000C1D5D2B|nr:uncharacterized protein LOC111384987 [Olea europaea var. sylvestris]
MGPDGYASYFFKKAWNIVGVNFMGAIKKFFYSCSLLKQTNHTVIALVPKGTHATSLGDYRPIACCNGFYKVITEILSCRLRPILGTIVDQVQVAFVEGRSMTENIHLAQELLRQYNRKRVAPRRLLKIDLKKAFDSVDWSFLESVFHGLNFPSKFIHWVMECITTPSYSIALNGSLHGFFKGKKGLRREDPLSPFLFVISLEYFSRILKGATDNSKFNFHAKFGALKITYLAFADDLMIFSRGDQTSVVILMDCLSNFGKASGLRMNVDKSCLYTASINGQELDNIYGLTNMSMGLMPFCYLGISLAAQKLKISSYDVFINKISAYICAWYKASLSYAGRAKLVRAILQGVECFWLSIFLISATVTSRVICLCRKFLWGLKKPLVACRLEQHLPTEK